MVDLETLDTTPTSVIVSIGAVKFGPNGYDKCDTFYRVVDIQSCIDTGLTISASTLSWWMNQSDAARFVSHQSSTHIATALIDFGKWLPNGVKLWGNGASFDNALDDAISQAEHLIQIYPGVT